VEKQEKLKLIKSRAWRKKTPGRRGSSEKGRNKEWRGAKVQATRSKTSLFSPDKGTRQKTE